MRWTIALAAPRLSFRIRSFPKRCNTLGVMPGLDPGIHPLREVLDRRIKSGDDGGGCSCVL
jgi:hypothetical protein